MVLKKQTIWLLTMLTLMVALSAYYLLSGENDEISISEDDPYAQLNGQNNDLINDKGVSINTTPTFDSESLFSTIRMEREQSRSQMMETYYQVVQNSKDNNAKAEASAKMEELDMLVDSESLVESLIKVNGFADAVVYTRDQKVNVIVQKSDLKKEEAVSIINLVAKNLNIPGINVSVNFTP